MKISVSILGEYERIINAVKKVNESKADYIHIDVMDGVFVENKKFPYEVVKDIKSISKKPLDVHMMVKSTKMIKKYCEIMPEYLTFHIEILNNYDIIDYVKNKGIKVGIAINLETDIKELTPILDDIDMVLFMSVHPGLGGQKFIEDVVEKIKDLKEIAPEDLVISVDGGVNDKTIELCKYAGCNMAVSGSFVTSKDNYDDAINMLKN